MLIRQAELKIHSSFNRCHPEYLYLSLTPILDSKLWYVSSGLKNDSSIDYRPNGQTLGQTNLV